MSLVPLAWGFANPAGPVQDEAFERIAARICAALSLALDVAPLDGVYLDLHGAALVESFPDAEGELLRRVRAIVGEAMPLTISLDPHANLTPQMVRLTDAAVPFRTYPHIDMKAAGALAMQLLIRRIERGQPWARAFRSLDFWIPLGSQCTMTPPMQTVMAERAALAERLGAVELGFCFGFPYADFAGCGPAIAAFADSQAQATPRRMQCWLMSTLRKRCSYRRRCPRPRRWQRRRAWLVMQGDPWCSPTPRTIPAAAAMATPPSCWRNWCGRRQRRRRVPDQRCRKWATCHAAGIGATVALSLGGKSDGMPFACSARVEALTDGVFTLTGPMGAGNPGNWQLRWWISSGVRVIVASPKMQALDQAIIRHVEIEPAECSIIALKSSVHFRADLAPVAEQIIVVVAPGPVVADPSVLNFRHVRAEVRRRPRATW